MSVVKSSVETVAIIAQVKVAMAKERKCGSTYIYCTQPQIVVVQKVEPIIRSVYLYSIYIYVATYNTMHIMILLL